jgi:hypothetical protein
VIYKPREWGGPGPLGAVAPNKRKKESNNIDVEEMLFVVGRRTQKDY